MTASTEYFNRIVRLKPIIEANAEIVQRIGRTFNHPLQYGIPPDDVIQLGFGTRHIVCGVGRIIDPTTENELFGMLVAQYTF